MKDLTLNEMTDVQLTTLLVNINIEQVKAHKTNRVLWLKTIELEDVVRAEVKLRASNTKSLSLNKFL